ncbi:MAG: glycosyltransferase [archaeon]
MKVSMIMPAYNEERRIRKTLEGYSSYFEGLRKRGKLDYEILVVINGTTDKTEEIVKTCSQNNSRILFLNLTPSGKGFATIEGFKDALKRNNDLIGFVDADMATLPEEYWKLIRFMGENKAYDVTIASRYMKGSVIKPKPKVQRLLAKWVFNVLVRSLLLMPFRDTQCGAKIFRKRALEEILPKLTMSQWAFDVDLLYTARKKSFRIKELPTFWEDKEYATINFWKAGPGMALGVVRLRLINSWLRPIVSYYHRLKKMGGF